MPNFIQCLLADHEDTDDEAIKLYHAADKRAREKAERSGRQMYAGDEVAEQLGLLLSEQIDGVNLDGKTIYDELLKKNWNWQAQVPGDDIKYCATVQLILNGVITGYQSDELLKECNEYKVHLEQLKQTETEKIRVETRKKGMYHLVNPKNKKTKEIAKQITAVELLIGALNADGDPSEKLKNFQEIYNDNKKIIEIGHDTAADKFQKVVKSILLILKGKVKEISSLWKTKGEKLVEKLPDAFKPVKKPYTKI